MCNLRAAGDLESAQAAADVQQPSSELGLQILGDEWRRVALSYQAKVHRVAIIILKAIFIGLGRDEQIVDEVQTIASLDTGLQGCSRRLEKPVPVPSRRTG